VSKVEHLPVMPQQVLDMLRPALSAPNSVLIDCTLGLGGHSEIFLETFANLHIIGFDQDESAIAKAKVRLAKFENQITLINKNFSQLKNELLKLKISSVNGIFFDLGVSSMQLDNRERGFSYLSENELDMRMNSQQDFSAKDLLNTWEEKEIVSILFKFGEEKFAKRIAANIIKFRAKKEITTTKELVDIIDSSIPAPARRTGGNPAKKTFQAIRIAVNSELAVLESALPQAVELLAPAGRIIVLTYHSLEDRIVKHFFKSKVEIEKIPRGVPVRNQAKSPFKLINSKAIKPSDAEISANRRSKSAKLRGLEKLEVAA
jgi:16S rRNA (cytosine1402-N4)-methyltransferase